jgi:hypothetical protein
VAWVITYHNYSSVPLRITRFGGVTQAVVGEINHEPGAALEIGASDYLSLDQNALSFVADGVVDFFQGIGTNGAMLWVRVHVPLQIFGIGTGPYWYYLTNQGQIPTLDDAEWQQHGSDTVNITMAGYAVTLSPTVQHSTLNLEVTFDDKH